MVRSAAFFLSGACLPLIVYFTAAQDLTMGSAMVICMAVSGLIGMKTGR